MPRAALFDDVRARPVSDRRAPLAARRRRIASPAPVLLVALVAALEGTSTSADAACNLIPRASATYRAAQGSTNRPFAAPGEFLELKLRPSVCDAVGKSFAPGLTDRVTLLFTPPDGPPNAVVLSTSCSFFTPGVESACASALGGGATATCIPLNPTTDVKYIAGLGGETRLQVRFPAADVSAGTCSGGSNAGRTCRSSASCGGGTCTGLSGGDHTLSGPAKIVVTDGSSALACGLASTRCASSLGTPGLVACVDELYELDGTCRKDPLLIDSTFGSFTVLPPPNSYQAMCTDPSPPCTGTATEARLTTDVAGNLLIPIDWRGILVRANQVPVPRLLRGSTPLEAFTGFPDPIHIPNGDFTGSFTPEGVKLPPIFEPQVDATAVNETTFFGTADAPYTILRVARKSPVASECGPGCNDGGSCVGRQCTADADCPGSSCAPTTCAGGANAGQECASDAGCPGSQCGIGAGLFDLSDRYAASVGPVVVTRFAVGAGVCETGGNEGAVCSSSAQCGGDNCVDYRIEAQDPVPLEGLAGSAKAFSFTVSESLAGRDLNGDGDSSDSVVLMRDRATGRQLAIGSGVFPGRAILQVTLPPLRYPSMAIEDDVVAFLESEALEQSDLNQDGNVIGGVLRVYRVTNSIAADVASGASFGDDLAVETTPLIDGENLAVSAGRVFFRLAEWANAGRVTSAIGPASFDSRVPSGSRDGRYVAFQTYDALAVDDTNNASDIYVFDTASATTTRVSVSTSGAQLSCCGSFAPRMSASGRYLAFVSDAYDVVPGVPGGTSRVYVHDRDVDSDGVMDEPGAIATTLVSASTAGSAVYGTDPSISENGRFIAYATIEPVDPGDTNGFMDIVLYDRDSDVDGIYDEVGGTSRSLISVAADGTRGSGPSLSPSISASGDRIAFFTNAFNLVSSTTTAVKDIPSGRLIGVPRAQSFQPQLSGDGRVVAYGTSDSLVAGDTNLGRDIYAFEIDTGQVQRISVGANGAQLGQFDISSGHDPAISYDGRLISYAASGFALIAPDPTTNFLDHYLSDRLTGETTRIAPVNSFDEFINDVPVLTAPETTTFATSQGIVRRGPDVSSPIADRSGDGVSDDTVLCVLDATTGPPAAITGLCPAGRTSVSAGAAAFLRPESAGVAHSGPCSGANLSGPDLNGDGDQADDIVTFWSATNGVRNLRCAASDVSLSPSHVVALVVEAAEPGAPSLNGDADTADKVVKILAVDGSTPSSCNDALWRNTQQAADVIAISGSTVAFITPESAQGSMSPDFGGTRDGDSADRVLQLFNASSSFLIPVRDGQARMQPAEEFVLDNEVVAFRSHEADLCGVPVTASTCGGGNLPSGCALATCDLNGDGDCCDDVLQTYDFGRPDDASCRSANPGPDCLRNSELAVTPCRLEACDPRKPYRVSGATVKFLTFEQEQNCTSGPDCVSGARDLNGDGDSSDLILQSFNARTGQARVIAAVDQASGAQTDPLHGDPLDTDSTGAIVAISKGVCVETLSSLPSCPGTPCPSGAFCEFGTCKRDQGVCVTSADCPGNSGPGGTVICRQDPIVPASADSDGDGVADPLDNCASDANPRQEDADADGVGDVCDAQTCGDGQVQVGEACDDGNTLGGDGCEANCTVSAVASTCASMTDAKLTLSSLHGALGDEGVSFSGKIQFGAGQPAGFTPLDALGRGAQLLIEDVGSGDAAVFELSHRTTPVPPGTKAAVCSPTKQDGWKANRALTSYTYTNATNALPNASCAAGSARGLKTLKLSDTRTSSRPSIGVTLKAAKSSIAPPVGPLRVTVVLGASAATGLQGSCGQVTFGTCASNGSGTAMICR